MHFPSIFNRLPDTRPRRSIAITCMALLAVCLLTACPPKPVPPDQPLIPIALTDYPYFEDTDGYAQLDQAIAGSLTYLRRLPASRSVAFGPDRYDVAHLIDSLETLSDVVRDKPASAQLNRIIRERFAVYQAAGRAGRRNVLFTGYYEPELNGSRTPDSHFRVPIHTRPADLLEIDLAPFGKDFKGRRIVAKQQGATLVPYPDRSGIRRIAGFDRMAPPIAWLVDEIDLFNLMIQGSGRVLVAGGEIIQVQFDVSNGRPYRSIGRLLIDQGKISPEQMSMQAIREYLSSHPGEMEAILDHNPRYIFFRQVDQGPQGALGVSLTPKRSVAVDRSLFPSAAPAFVQLSVPRLDGKGRIAGWRPHAALVLAQDAGSAIKGPGRVDLFWGHGAAAETCAGRLKHPGSLYFLVLKSRRSVREHPDF